MAMVSLYWFLSGENKVIRPQILTSLDRELSSKITQKQRDVAVSKLDVYKEWFLDVVMKQGERDTLVLIPIENISPRYRDDPPL